jgi:diacylglycerol kinase (ATP)
LSVDNTTGLKRRIRFIINPVAGTSKKHRIPDKINRFLDHKQFDFDIIQTQERGHANQLAIQAAKEGIDVVAVAGGDGSVNEVASGLIDTETALAILPLGSGNGLARHLGYSLWVKSTLDVINQYHVVDMDMGTVNDKPFYSLIGLGFDAFVAKIFDRGKTRGLYTYGLASTSALFKWKPFPYRLETPNKVHEGEAFMINVCNSNQFGYNFKVAPDAEINDGQFNVVIVEPFPKWKAGKLFYDLSVENHLKSEYIRSFEASNIKISAPERAYLQIDGEPQSKSKQFDIKLFKGRLKVLRNPKKHI